MTPTQPDASSRSLGAAVDNVELGLPIPKGTRRRFLKRLVERLSRPLLQRQIAFNRAVVAELARLQSGLDDLCAQTAQLGLRIDSQLDDLRAQLGLRIDTGLDGVYGQVAPLGPRIDSGLEGLRAQIAQFGPRIDLVQRQAFTREHDALAALRDEIGQLGRQVQEALAAGERDRSGARIRQAQVDLFLTEVRRSFPAPPDGQRLSQLPSAVDNMYVALEEAFRGSNELSKERAREYLDDVLSLPRDGPVVDVGCGRGEWLEVLKEAGVDAYGIDINPDFVDGCLARGLDARLGNALQRLTDVPARSLTAVTAFHVAEHLPIEALVELIDLSVRALKPGGLLVLETPNPDNLIVGASTFYIDPTHVRPLNPDFLAFLVGARGLSDVEVRYKHPVSDGVPTPDRDRPWAADLIAVVEALNHWIFGAGDYAVLGRRI